MEDTVSVRSALGEGRDRLPLAVAQEQLWFVEQMSPGEPIYNVPLTYRLRGDLDTAALRRALAWVVARHDALRATVAPVDGVPYQRIAPPGPEVAITLDDVTTTDADDRDRQVARIAREEASTPFDLTTGPLHRFRLVRFDDREHLLCITIHHIVTDGWSTGLVNRELSAAYAAYRAGREPADVLPPADPADQLDGGDETYVDHIVRQRKDLTEQGAEDSLRYWQEHLAGLPVVDLPADRARPATQTFHGDLVDVRLPEPLVRQARAVAYERGTTLFTVLTAALTIVVNRYTGQPDIPLGMTMTGRDTPEVERLVGLFANMVVLRADLSGDPSFAELLDRLTDRALDALDHAAVPFERVVERVRPTRDPGRNPLFQISVQMLGDANSGANLELAGLEVEPVAQSTGRARFDLAVTFVESADGVRTTIEYATDLFDRWRVEALAGHLETVLTAVLRDPSGPLSRVPVVGAAERARLLAWGTAERTEPYLDPVHVRIARTAAAMPDHPAVVFEGRSLTYAELDRRADQLARYLRARGVTHQEIVPLVIRRDLDTLVTLLGVLKAGAAFAVLDPDHPTGRLDYVIRDTGARLVLTRSDLLDRLPTADGWTAVAVDTEWPAIEAAEGPLPERAGPDSLAYVLYTSGSTGRPKGVQIEHRALNAFATGYQRIFDLTPDDRMLQFNALAFDMCQGETFTGLTVGATLVLVPPDVVGSPEQVAELMRAERVSYVCIPPAMMALMESAPYPALRKIMVGGEAAPGDLVNRWNLPGRRMLNVYGPTEATVGCTSYECAHRTWRSSPPIGAPMLDRRVYVVDATGDLAPVGVPGELLIGGEGLSRGYVNLPDLDAARFRPDPFHPGARVYRSGDLVRWTADGLLEFIGRLDHQVKLRGLRIELGEIEAVLASHPSVGMAVTALRPDARGENQIVGYVVPADPSAPSTAELRRYAGEHLPAYMVPATVMVLDTLPTTTSGKVDRDALPQPPLTDPDDGPTFEEPATPTEARVAAILAGVLSLPRVGADANLFQLGGSSLQATRVVSRLNREFGVTVRVRMLYGSATVRTIAAAIDDMVAARDAAAGTTHPEGGTAGAH
ncbi:non-ribosomal peptide synthetase [Micromonospora sagamiensis]|uniref:Amino acid adenylation domain-containing protein n=1 Tax=Micromonospora sagamiensis TaxID=47875 RepID=A0A562WGJ4_9ACTN|nr:non-ribosomal peptide synthetase [Micromonospora sagamiensis]TWJ29429.1 amino acid adenylation domain-containing protein [Micromonospora sagamiensis]BCL17541.1 hypothetical protein GCM10017556_52800 [Micromonospora sagamiensis]